MPDTQRSKPPPAKPDRSEKTLLELPGFKVGLVNEPEPPSRPQPLRQATISTGALVLSAVVATVILLGLFRILGGRQRRKR
jgi:hypothetical protein